jgi:flagellar motor component MotA
MAIKTANKSSAKWQILPAMVALVAVVVGSLWRGDRFYAIPALAAVLVVLVASNTATLIKRTVEFYRK